MEYEKLNDNRDPRRTAIPDVHGHAKGEHKPYAEERPIPLSARMLFLWFFHACRRGYPRFLMVSDHMNYLTFEDPAAVNLVRRALKLAQAGDLYGAAETANVDVAHARVVHDGMRRGMRYSIGAEVDNDPRCRPDAQNIVDSMKPDGMIRSIHFLAIDHPQHGAAWPWAFDNPEFIALWDHVGTAKAWELYIAAVLDAIERLPGTILGHFYVPAVFGHWPDDATLEGYEDAVLDALLARGMAIEINSRFLYRHPEDHENRAKFIAANTRLLRKAKQKGVPITASSDAHSPRDQGNAYDVVLQMLDDADVNELVFPIGGKFARVQLRAEKPAEPVPVVPPAREEPIAATPAPAADVVPDTGSGALASAERETGEREAAERPASEPKARSSRAGSARTTVSPAADAQDRPTKARTGSRRTAPRVDLSADAANESVGESPDAAAAPAIEPPDSPPETKAKPSPKTVAPKTGKAIATKTPVKSAVKAPAAAAKTSAKSVVGKPASKTASAPKPAAKLATKQATKVAAKVAPAKPPAAKAAPAKTAAKPATKKPAAAKSAPVKAKPAAAKSAPAKAKVAPPKASAKKPAAKATATKPVATKANAAKAVPAKKSSATKTPAKKTAPKRR